MENCCITLFSSYVVTSVFHLTLHIKIELLLACTFHELCTRLVYIYLYSGYNIDVLIYRFAGYALHLTTCSNNSKLID